MPAQMTTVRDATLALLRRLGMTRVFGNPGSTELPMFRDFPADFDYVLGLQEATVVAMADGYAQATRTAALVNLHSSAGVGHALGNIFTAFKNQAPLVVTAGQQARSILPFEPFLHAERATEFPRPFVKWACEPARAADVPRAIARAHQIAMTPPFGPTFVSVPVDDWDQPGEAIEPRTITTANPGDPAALDELAQALAGAERPALILGAGAARDGAWDAAIRFAEAHSARVYAAPFACRNAFPEDHRCFAGFLRASRQDIVAQLGRHDLALVVGGPLNLYHTEAPGPHVPEGLALWLVDDNPAVLSWAPCGRGILANSRSALETLAARATPGVRPAPAPRDPVAAPDGDRMIDRLAMHRIAALRPRESVIVEEAPSSRAAMYDLLPMLRADGFYTTASGGLGYALPASVGIALARPGERVIALIGDGSAMYSIQALFTASRLNLPLSVLVIVNHRYEALESFGRHFGLTKVEGTDLSGLDFCALAAGHGMAARRADTPEALDAALAWSFATPTPTLVEIVVD
ncbi:benzoylformate decarboxylase [Sphingomonas hengshuiensis]|uniref:Benzoylformate decarboxylase n=1 Tax=Sphingomonas hengshuiensis TaxID=1609977 RepID=A0A7U4JBN4_9SPHN|nr:benzoylformate decarboxylase [Sphingomonas hengshuiensis]AJP73848.1 benzoylformate decarboxylase [Sphingomonas hengshuiensis]